MEMKTVASSNIHSVGWEASPKGKGNLFVKFHHGGEYRYEGVPEDVFRSLLRSSSVGSYFANNVRDRYASTKIGG